MLSDNFLINAEVSLQRTFFPVTSDSYRSDQLIVIHVLLLHLKVSQLVLDLPKDLDQLADLHDSTLRDLINKYTPLRVRQMSQRALITLNNKNI